MFYAKVLSGNWWNKILGKKFPLGDNFKVDFHIGKQSIEIKGHTASDGTQTLIVDANGGTRYKLIHDPSND